MNQFKRFEQKGESLVEKKNMRLNYEFLIENKGQIAC